MRAITRTDPNPVSVGNMMPGSGATGTYVIPMTVSLPLATGTTVAWINPEVGTVMAKAWAVYTTAGTGTVDIGVTDDGTASAATFVDGGTMAAGFLYAQEFLGTVAASHTAGGAGTTWALVGPGGTGTNNSITITNNEALTSTAVGRLVVEYFPIG